MKKTTKKLSLKGETIKALNDASLQRAAGGATGTCLGTDCQCAPTFDAGCPTVGWTRCHCSVFYTCYSKCGCP